MNNDIGTHKGKAGAYHGKNCVFLDRRGGVGMTATTLLHKTRIGRTLLLTMESSCGKNPVSPELGRQITDAIGEAQGDAGVGVILLKGAGKVFSAGGDINGLIASFDAPMPDAELRRQLAQSASGCLALMDSAKPTIALVNGAAAGGGLAVAAACDIRVAGQSAKFAYAYPRIALAGDLAANWSLTRILGPAKARYFCLTGKILTASEAQRIGLVEEVHADAELETAGLAFAEVIGSMSPMALAQVKVGMDAASALPRDAAIEVETANFLIARRHPDHREAAMAFLEKRPPNWGASQD